MRVEYSADKSVAYYNGYKFNRDGKTGYYLCTKKTDTGRRDRLHVYVWRKERGEIPEGFHIHHKDEDKGHNDIENLACIPGKMHSKFHSREYAVNHYEDMKENLLNRAVPASKAWHRSEVGREWHRQQGYKIFRNMEKSERVCDYCGKKYETIYHGNNRFCSNACKAAFRRDSGVDDVVKICKCCGGEYYANKYQKSAFCSDCKDRARRDGGSVQYGSCG